MTKHKSLAEERPDLLKEWDYEKNDKLGLDPKRISVWSHKKVCWKCNKGHEWEACICDRNQGNGCPYCSNKKILVGYNDLATINPILVKEWNYSKNGNLLPTQVLPFSNKKIWWICSKGHEWKALISVRNRGSNCPVCSNKLIIEGINDLVTLNPNLASEWNYDKNGNLLPTQVSCGSNKKVWWKCNKCKNEWQAVISSRNNGCGCPVCGKMRVALKNSIPKKGQSLYDKFPFLVREWNYEKNNNLLPTQVACGSGKKVWWKCSKGHEWQATISSRVSQGVNCPYCSNQRVLSGFNDLKTLRPDLLDEWDYDKNGNLLPSQVTVGSNKKVWWKCSKGHSWKIAVYARNDGRGCPYCANQKLWKGFNDFKTLYPELAKEWNYEKNGDLKPTDVLYGSSKIVWWKCSKGHEWQVSISNRFNRHTGCPICLNKIVLKGYNDLQSVCPHLMEEWDFKKNNLKPDELVYGSPKMVWWKCKKCGHEWQSSVRMRYRGHGCPKCAHNNLGKHNSKKGLIIGVNDLETLFPNLVEEWNYVRNGFLLPSQFKCGSNFKVWWKCKICGYEWQSVISHRTKGHGCLECAKARRGKKKKATE